jgi:hypothetical protein
MRDSRECLYERKVFEIGAEELSAPQAQAIASQAVVAIHHQAIV